MPADPSAPTRTGVLASFGRWLLNNLGMAGLILAVVVAHDRYLRPTPVPASLVDGKALARSMVTALMAAEAESFEAERQAILGGKTMKESLDVEHNTHLAARQKLFAALVSPVLAKIVPEKAEPADASKRAEYAAAVADIAAEFRAMANPPKRTFLWWSW